LGDGGDEPTEELSVMDVPRDRGEVEETSESLSELRDEAEEIDDTLRSFWAASMVGALMVSTFVVDRRTGEDIFERSNDRSDAFVRRFGIGAVSSTELFKLLRLERDVKDRDIAMVICYCV
jgi:hypothetical protein